MSYFDYKSSQVLALADYPFYALIMAAMRKADTNNLNKLREAWPDIFEELMDRYNAPGGILPGEQLPVVNLRGDDNEE